MKMKTTEILHGFWAGTHTASPEVRRSWQQISKTIEASVPEEQRKVLLQMMAEHCYIVEHSGFAAGFKTAAELWRELE